MTISTTGNQITYTGDGASVAFPFPYPFITSADLKVYVDGVLQSAGYSVSGTVPSGGSGTYSSGTVTFAVAPATSAVVLIYCDPDLLQSTSLPPNDPFPSKTVERMVDKVTLLIQRLKAAITGALTFPAGDTTSGVLPALASRLDRLLYFNGSGIPSITSFTQTQVASAIAAAYAASGLADAVSFLQAGIGAIARSVQDKLRDRVSITDFGGVAGSGDNSAAMLAAVNTGKIVFLPAGRWRMNVTIAAHTRLEGEGGNGTFIEPYNAAVAAITYTATSPYWTYHTDVIGICFRGTGKVGIGWTFGDTLQANFIAGMQYAGNVRFIGCRFEANEKGVQRPFGNIGVYFFDCGFSGNKYGTYSLDNKQGGDSMHAGNLYIRGGESDNNDCAHYLHNVTDGFYGPVITDHIYEQNGINEYLYSTSCLQPTAFENVGAEANATLATVPFVNVTVDTWVGAVKGTTSLPARAWIVDGSNQTVLFNGGGIITDINLRASSSRVLVRGSRAETVAGFGGAASNATGADSSIQFEDITTAGGAPRGAGVYVSGRTRVESPTINSSSTDAVTRSFIVAHRHCTRPPGRNVGTSTKCTVAEALSGSFTPTGVVTVDGTLYPACLEFTIPFTLISQFCQLPSSNVASTTAGWYVATADVKVVSGSPSFYFWDRSTAQMATSMVAPTAGVWTTFAALGYSAGGQQLFFDVGGASAGVVVRYGPVQIRWFDSLAEAQAFLDLGAFIEPIFYGSAVYDPANLADGAGVTTTVTVTGAALGDMAAVSNSLDLQGITLTAWVSAANTVSVRFQNETGGAIDLASGTLRVVVTKA